MTKSGRTVYGGGGITPDIIIQKDTTVNYLQINMMINKGWINEFCLKQSNKLKKENISHYSKINVNSMYNKYLLFINNKDRDFNLKLGNTEHVYFKNLLLATISRNIWENDIYYEIISTNDEYIQRAINEF